MTVCEILKKAREIISNPANWTKDVFARNAQDVPTSLFGEDACKFCASGAVCRTTKDKPGREIGNDEQKAFIFLNEVAGNTISLVNDKPDTTHNDIMNIFDKAIQLAEEREKMQ